MLNCSARLDTHDWICVCVHHGIESSRIWPSVCYQKAITVRRRNAELYIFAVGGLTET